MKAFVQKVIFAYEIFLKILLMALAPGLMAIFHFSFQFPLYFLKIYKFELINYFDFGFLIQVLATHFVCVKIFGPIAWRGHENVTYFSLGKLETVED